jgi:hypothetical protein
MSDPEHPRDAAIRKYNERKADQRRKEEEQNREKIEQEQRREQNTVEWRTVTTQVILQNVYKVTEDYARRSSPYRLEQVHSGDSNVVAHAIRESGKLNPLGLFLFEFNPSGRVTARTGRTEVSGINLPRSASLDECDAAWVESVTDEVMLAFLNSR